MSKPTNKKSTPPAENSTEEKKFVNPFVKGVTYVDFIEALGEQTIKEYCGDFLGIQEIAWLENEIEHYKNK
jgi:type III secretory pathway component EscV